MILSNLQIQIWNFYNVQVVKWLIMLDVGFVCWKMIVHNNYSVAVFESMNLQINLEIHCYLKSNHWLTCVYWVNLIYRVHKHTHTYSTMSWCGKKHYIKHFRAFGSFKIWKMLICLCLHEHVHCTWTYYGLVGSCKHWSHNT